MNAPAPHHQPPGTDGSRERGALAQRIALGVNIAAIGLAGWSLFPSFPTGQLIAVVTVIPLLALILTLRFPDRFRIGLGSGYGANLGTGCIVAAGTLAARTLSDVNLVSWLPLAAFAVAVAVVFLIVAIRFESQLRRRGWRILLASLFVGAYAFGTLGQFNTALDHSAPALLRSRVLSKHLGHSRLATHQVTLEAWGPFAMATDAHVTQALYERLQPGDAVCLRLRDGAFRMAWFTVAACR
ncbi:conserved membrane protein of unknown function [Bradyrhizobium sp. ORS 285]|uniref:hypothetical protein n=1 Tax=Bradyrhizobium sp. ORS 285 TaxID=115808 RepID=UPI000240AB1E|nr:hypothetical protein [Bradyrhizobium sp. ORS 285]CCD84130.1 conserved membrane hypothetical protein [Bradyrhizobium sp. ORS 285]SMX57153.1 conserved membrane protein of unknown function [Bradyrhizobium sp. ORS 285]